MAGDIDFNLDRFIQAQNPIYEQALTELLAGRKRSHWMWFIFPQIAGLGMSAMSQKFAIRSAEEAIAYLKDPILGGRITRCCEAVLAMSGLSVHDILGSPDDVKLCSSMTLFAAVSSQNSPFHRVIERYYGGRFDERTVEILNAAS